jgi:hypothetical protein
MRRLLSFAFVLLLAVGTQAQQTPTAPAAPLIVGGKAILEDATSVRLRLSRNLSSTDAHAGDTVEFEVLEEVKIGDALVIPKGGIAWGTVTEAEHKKRMARGGKVDVTIDAVRLLDGERAALRGVKDASGGGHTGAMTGGIVATAIIAWPAAPFFLFMHGKDVTIPKGTEVVAFINGNFPLDLAKFAPQSNLAGGAQAAGASSQAPASSQVLMEISSTPPGADIELDGSFVGSTPSSVSVFPGEHTVKLTKSGYSPWERKIKITAGNIKIAPDLEPIAPTPGK